MPFQLHIVYGGIKWGAARRSFICVHQFNEETRLANSSKLPWSFRTPLNKTTSGCLPHTSSVEYSLHHFTINYCPIKPSWLRCIHADQQATFNPLPEWFLLSTRIKNIHLFKRQVRGIIKRLIAIVVLHCASYITMSIQVSVTMNISSELRFGDLRCDKVKYSSTSCK